MPTSLAQKLQLKPGKLIVLNAPKEYAGQLSKELKDITVSTRAGGQGTAQAKDAARGEALPEPGERMVSSRFRCGCIYRLLCDQCRAFSPCRLTMAMKASTTRRSNCWPEQRCSSWSAS